MVRLFKAFIPIFSDFLSTIVFVIVMAATDNLVESVLAGMAVGVGQIAVEKIRGRKIELMQWASLVLVIVLGSASIYFKDPRFAMIKPSIGNFAIGLVMLTPNWMGRYLPQIVKDNVSPTALVVWGYVWAVLELGLAAANTWVALTLGKRIWLEYTAFVPLGAQVTLFLVQYAWLRITIGRTIRARMGAQAA
ncbi:MAG TPA: septation protein IspZ [Rhizomicrobium sp.]|nr:septation protein IspZ [Rhizomicrobium sp.]